MGTFSQLVDEITAESNRFDLRATVATYANQTIRECHSDPIRENRIVTYGANLKEAQIAATLDSGQVWGIPYPQLYQEMRAVRFDSIYDSIGQSPYATLIKPGPRLEDELYAYYRTGDSIALKGYGGIGALISIAWYEYVPRLLYYPVLTRPASYSIETDTWTYLAGITTQAQQAAARLQCTNWMIQRWYDTIAEGVRAKIYKRVSDQDRGRTSYSLYQAMRNALVSAEAYDYGG